MSRKSPRCATKAFSPFICASSEPLTTITVSVGVCQCHGATHPGANLARMTEASLPGSPFSTATVKHFGAFGTAPNLALAAGFTVALSPVSPAESRSKPKVKTLDAATIVRKTRACFEAVIHFLSEFENYREFVDAYSTLKSIGKLPIWSHSTNKFREHCENCVI